MEKIFLASVAVLILLSACPSVTAGTLEGKVIRNADGDTITVLMDDLRQIKIRLYGVDTPEKAQPYGHRAKQFTAAKIGNKKVIVQEYGKDRYGRLVGIVKINENTSINEELIRNGLAWVYEKYCNIPICTKWKKIEEQSRKNKIGLWQDKNALPPWNWRKGKRK